MCIKNDPKKYENIEYQDAYTLWFKLNEELFPSLGKTRYICFLYIPPSNSRWFQSGKSYNFEKLMDDVAKFEGLGAEVIIMGDMNGRIAQENDFLNPNNENDIDDYLPIPDDFEMDNSIVNRSTLDKTEISGHGRDLLSFCKATRVRIPNGRVGDDHGIGNFTCHTPAGSSLVDYCLIRDKNFHLINNFSVIHFQIILTYNYV